MKRVIHSLWPPLALVVALLLAWELLVFILQIRSFLLPAPSAVLRALIENAGPLSRSLGLTALAAVGGLAIAAIVGTVVGSVVASNRLLYRGAYPIARLLQMVALVAIAPQLLIWFGYGVKSALASAAIVSVFPVIANTVDGLRSTDPNLREIFRLYGASRSTTWWKLALPWAVPNIVTGLRIASGLSVIGAIVGEFVSGYAGADAPLGVVVLSSLREARTDLVFAAVALGALVGFTLFGAVSALGWLLMRGRA
jgi:NitT/TauT family transport system permease protein